jgi:hypothetical protein
MVGKPAIATPENKVALADVSRNFLLVIVCFFEFCIAFRFSWLIIFHQCFLLKLSGGPIACIASVPLCGFSVALCVKKNKNLHGVTQRSSLRSDITELHREYNYKSIQTKPQLQHLSAFLTKICNRLQIYGEFISASQGLL